jgi:hypothetical protein
MPLPTGIWKANVNGTEIDLTINAPNQQSVFFGQFLGAEFKGFWDESTQSVAFTVNVIFEGSTPVTASFGGHLFRSPTNAEPGRDVVATIAGSLHMSVGHISPGTFPAIGTSRRNVFGWFAQITEVQ